MLGFFNQRSRVCALMQALNTAALILAISEMMNDPDQAYEWGLDALTHFLSLLALVEKPSSLATASSIAINFMRLGAIYGGITSGVSALSNMANLFDAAAHLGNIFVPVATADREPVQVQSPSM